jgi:hypothetical protein
MTTRLLTLLLAAAAALGVTACADTYGYGRRSETRVQVSGSYGSFDDYDALAPYGTWVAVSYGWAWCPLDVPAGWRPYTVGRWVYTDWGWMWLSDDPWGALPYHYGRWGYDDSYGWVWIPGDVWAPAWVAWRYADDWVGWAPLPPDLGWQVGVGFRYSVSSVDRRIDPLSWCFVGTSGFQSARVADRLAPPSRNVTLLTVTKNVTRYDDVDSRPAERGLRPEWVSGRGGRPVTQYRITDAASPSYGTRPALRGREITVHRAGPEGAAGREDIVRAAPPERERTAASRRLIERQKAESSQIPARMQRERAELARIQERERRDRPGGVSPEALRQRHQAEQRAQDAREERMRRAYERRQEELMRQDRNDNRNREEPERGRGRGRRGQGERSSL